MKRAILFILLLVFITIMNIPKLNNIDGILSNVVSSELSIANSGASGCERVFAFYTTGDCSVLAYDCFEGGNIIDCWEGMTISCHNPDELIVDEQIVHCN